MFQARRRRRFLGSSHKPPPPSKHHKSGEGGGFIKKSWDSKFLKYGGNKKIIIFTIDNQFVCKKHSQLEMMTGRED